MAIYKTIQLFSDVNLLVAGLELQNDKATLDCDTYVYDDHWPLNRESNLAELEKLKRRWPRLKIIHGPENLGIHKGFNHLTSQMPLVEGDIIICTAPDSVPLQKGWDEAMAHVLTNDRNIAYVGTNSFNIDATDCNWEHVNFGSLKVKLVRSRPAMFHSTAFQWDFLKKAGGFHQPCNYYGHLESQMFQKMQSVGMRSGYLCDFYEDFRLQPFHGDEYFAYKMAQAHTYSFAGSFKEYLEMRKK